MNASGLTASSAEPSWRPLPNRREIAIEAADKARRRHWTGLAGCWCGSRHGAGEEGLTLVPPPWAKSRQGERVPAGVAW